MLERENDPSTFKIVSPNAGADYFINQASVDELLTKFHEMTLGELKHVDVERMEFYKTVLMGRYTDAQIKALDRLTTRLKVASWTSTLIGIGLISVGLGTWALFGLEVYKIFWAK